MPALREAAPYARPLADVSSTPATPATARGHPGLRGAALARRCRRGGAPGPGATVRRAGRRGEASEGQGRRAALIRAQRGETWLLGLWAVVVPAALLLWLVRSLAERVAPGRGTLAAVALGAGTLVLPYATMLWRTGHDVLGLNDEGLFGVAAPDPRALLDLLLAPKVLLIMTTEPQLRGQDTGRWTDLVAGSRPSQPWPTPTAPAMVNWKSPFLALIAGAVGVALVDAPLPRLPRAQVWQGLVALAVWTALALVVAPLLSVRSAGGAALVLAPAAAGLAPCSPLPDTAEGPAIRGLLSLLA